MGQLEQKHYVMHAASFGPKRLVILVTSMVLMKCLVQLLYIIWSRTTQVLYICWSWLHMSNDVIVLCQDKKRSFGVDSRVRALTNLSPVNHCEQPFRAIRSIKFTYTIIHHITPLWFILLNKLFLLSSSHFVHEVCADCKSETVHRRFLSHFHCFPPTSSTYGQPRLIPKPIGIHVYNYIIMEFMLKIIITFYLNQIK